MACGTPVLSFNIGGMAEYIQPGFNGLLAYEVTVSSLVAVLEKFINTKDSFCSTEIRDFAVKTFSKELIAKKYIEVYSANVENNE